MTQIHQKLINVMALHLVRRQRVLTNYSMNHDRWLQEAFLEECLSQSMKIDGGKGRKSRSQSSKGLSGTGEGPNPAGFSTLCGVLSCSSFPTHCEPRNCSSPVFPVPGISQARILEWVVISSSRGFSQPRDWTCVACISCVGRWILYLCTTWEALVSRTGG